MPQFIIPVVKGVASLITGAIAPTSAALYTGVKYGLYTALSVGVSYGSKAIQRLAYGKDGPNDFTRDFKQPSLSAIRPAWVTLGYGEVGGNVHYFGEFAGETRLGISLSLESIEGILQIKNHGEVIETRVDGRRIIPVATSKYSGHLEFWPYLLANGTQGREMDFDGLNDAQKIQQDYGDIVEFDSNGNPIDSDGNIVDDLNTVSSSNDDKIWAFPEWNSDYKLMDYSWVYVKYNQNAFSSVDEKPIFDKPPIFTFVLKGAKIQVPDSTGVLQPAAWTENAADLRYYIETKMFGVDPSTIDIASFIAAKMVCAESVTIADSEIPMGIRGQYTQTRLKYYINGSIEYGSPSKRLTDYLDVCWAGEVVKAKGKRYFRAGAERPPLMTIDVDSLKVSSRIVPSPPVNSRINTYIGELAQDQDNNWGRSALAKYIDQPAKDRDGRERPVNVKYPFTTNQYTAARLQAIAARRARESLEVQYVLRPDDAFLIFKPIPTDTLLINDSEWGFVNSKFIVLQISIREWHVILHLKEDIPNTYANTLIAPELHSREIHLTDRTFVSRLSGLTLSESVNIQTDGTEISTLVASWDSKPVARTEVRARIKNTTQWLPQVSTTDEAEFISVAAGATYQVEARHVNIYGYSGGWVKAELALGGDSTAPGTTTLDPLGQLPLGLSAKWDNPNDNDYSHSIVQVRQTDNTVVFEGKTNGEFSQIYGLTGGTSYKIRVRAVDYSGNMGVWSNERQRQAGAMSVAEDGSQIFYGDDAPANSLGENNDIYVRGNGVVYKKENGAWVDTGIDLTGPENARVYSAGDVDEGETPDVPDGAINGSVIVANDGRFWELVNNVWVYRGDLTGPIGDEGKPATGWILPRKYQTALASLGTDGFRIHNNILYIVADENEPLLRSIPQDTTLWLLDGTTIRRFKINTAASLNANYISWGIVTENGDIDSISAGDSVNLNFTYARGEQGYPALSYEMSKAYVLDLTGTPDVLANQFNIHGNGLQARIGVTTDDNDDEYLQNLKLGSTIWMLSGFFRFDAVITAKLRSVTTQANRKIHVLTLTPSIPMFYGIAASNGDVIKLRFSSGDSGNGGTEPPTLTVPGAPSNLSISSVGTTQLNLFWDTPSDNGGSAITGYRIDRSVNPSSNFATIVSSQTERTYNNTGLNAGTRYYYRVYAINAQGTSTLYASADSTTGATSPNSPRSFTSSNLGETTATIGWDAPSSWGTGTISSRKYEYRYGTSSSLSGAWTEIDDSVRSVNLSGLTDGTQYFVQVRAKTNVGTSSHLPGNFTTNQQSFTAPGIPNLLEASDITNTGALISWNAPASWGTAPASSRKYEYRYGTSSSLSGAWTEIDDSVREVDLTGLTASTMYTFQVRAKTSGGTSLAQSVGFTTNADTLQPVEYELEANPRGAVDGDLQNGECAVLGGNAYFGNYTISRLNEVRARDTCRLFTSSGGSGPLGQETTYASSNVRFATVNNVQCILLDNGGNLGIADLTEGDTVYARFWEA